MYYMFVYNCEEVIILMQKYIPMYYLEYPHVGWLVWFIMVFNATFNNISVISWWLVLLVEETGRSKLTITSSHILT